MIQGSRLVVGQAVFVSFYLAVVGVDKGGTEMEAIVGGELGGRTGE